MATIVSTSVRVYSGTSTAGSQVGNTITEQGSPATVALDLATLGVALQPGHQYCVQASCTNNEQYTATSQEYLFRTLIFTELLNLTASRTTITATQDFDYDTTDHNISISECGVYISTNASGSSATRVVCSGGAQDAGQGWDIPGLNENTRYYVLPFVVDDLSREYKGAWSHDAESVVTGYAAPTVTISNVSTTWNSVSGNVAVTTNDTVSSVILTIEPASGGNPQTKTLTAQTALQTWSITSGDLDDSSNPITINPSTTYRVTITATTASSDTGSGATTATTAAQTTATIAITSIDNIGPFGARVNLSYGGGVQQITP